jgi:hypothetical protein
LTKTSALWIEASGVDGYHYGLGSEFGADFADEVGAGEGGGVDADLVCARVEEGGGLVGGADASADGEGNEELLGSALHGVHQGTAAFVGGGDVEEDDFVGSGSGVTGGELGGVAGIDQVDELHAFDDAAGPDVEAGDDALGQHGFHSRKLLRT